MDDPLDNGRKGVPFTFTPTEVRATGNTERLSSHRADDERLGEPGDFERDVLRRGDYKRNINVRKRGRASR